MSVSPPARNRRGDAPSDGVFERLLFGPDACAAWVAFTDRIASSVNGLEDGDTFRGVLSKLSGYGARFAGLLWAVRRRRGDHVL